MKRTAVILLSMTLLLVFSCDKTQKDEPGNNQLTAEEVDYLKARDSSIAQLGRATLQLQEPEQENNYDSLVRENDAVLSDLEQRLRNILAGAPVKTPGTISLMTLFDEPGIGMLDGLIQWGDSSTRIFYTSKRLFYNYFKTTEAQFADSLKNDIAGVFNSTFMADAGVTNFTTIRLPVANLDSAVAMVAVVAQDIGPFPPEYLYVFLSDDAYVYMAEQTLKEPINEIPSCRAEWERMEDEAQTYVEKYHASNRADTAAWSEYMRREDLAWEAYVDCYRRELKSDPQFSDLKAKLEAMVAQLASFRDR